EGDALIATARRFFSPTSPPAAASRRSAASGPSSTCQRWPPGGVVGGDRGIPTEPAARVVAPPRRARPSAASRSVSPARIDEPHFEGYVDLEPAHSTM